MIMLLEIIIALLFHNFACKARAVGKGEAKDVHALRLAAPIKAHARAAYQGFAADRVERSRGRAVPADTVTSGIYLQVVGGYMA